MNIIILTKWTISCYLQLIFFREGERLVYTLLSGGVAMGHENAFESSPAMERFLCERLLDRNQPISERFRALFSLRNLSGPGPREALIRGSALVKDRLLFSVFKVFWRLRFIFDNFQLDAIPQYNVCLVVFSEMMLVQLWRQFLFQIFLLGTLLNLIVRCRKMKYWGFVWVWLKVTKSCSFAIRITET